MTRHGSIVLLGLVAMLLCAASANSEEEVVHADGSEADRTAEAAEEPLDDAESESVEFEHLWSTTLMGQFRIISAPQANDDVGDFFDLYEWTPNKGSALPTELAIRDAAWDVFGPDDTPLIQFRLESPTSNLGISGSQIDQPFLNQRADLFGRFEGVALDFEYWRFRTEELRLFPRTAGRPYSDLTQPGDRFNHDRTGFFGELRFRPLDVWPEAAASVRSWLDPQLSVRGGYDYRTGLRQFRYMADRTNEWIGFSQPLDQDVSKVGGGVLLVPGGLFTLDFDVDYKRFRNEPTVFEGQVTPAVSNPFQTVDFIPNTDRTSGTIQLQGRLGKWAVLEGGFQASRLQQVDGFTPLQVAAGLTDNQLIYYSANAAVDIDISQSWSTTAYVKYDRRNNDIDRNTSLFNPVNGSQVDAFLKTFDRIDVGGELIYRPRRRNILAVGARYERIDRDIVDALPISPNPVILRQNALIADATRMWTVYGRTRLRPVRGLSFSGEVGYRGAPETAYIVELDDYIYGELRASYTVPLERPVMLTAFAKGGSGKNRDFTMVDGTGPLPSGPLLPRRFDRTDYLWGLTASSSPMKDVTLFASFFRSCGFQDDRVVLSSLPRYLQLTRTITFAQDGTSQFRDKRMSAIVGVHTRLLEKTDAGFAYSFTLANATYDVGIPSDAVRQMAFAQDIDAKIHGLDFETGHWVRDGLKVLVGYRLQLLDDSGAPSLGLGSVVPPIPLSMTQHTVTFGVTLTSDLLAKSD